MTSDSATFSASDSPTVDAPATARSYKLPTARHASRVPDALTPVDLARIQQAAYQLPQVVKPADYIDEHSPHFEQHLDTLGLILLQKAVAGSRGPAAGSRRIEDGRCTATPWTSSATGPQVRALMQARTVELESLGVTRDAGEFDRFLTETLLCCRSSPAGRRQIAYRQRHSSLPRSGISTTPVTSMRSRPHSATRRPTATPRN